MSKYFTYFSNTSHFEQSIIVIIICAYNLCNSDNGSPFPTRTPESDSPVHHLSPRRSPNEVLLRKKKNPSQIPGDDTTDCESMTTTIIYKYFILRYTFQ